MDSIRFEKEVVPVVLKRIYLNWKKYFFDDDLVQEVMLQCWKASSVYDDTYAISTFFGAVTDKTILILRSPNRTSNKHMNDEFTVSNPDFWEAIKDEEDTVVRLLQMEWSKDVVSKIYNRCNDGDKKLLDDLPKCNYIHSGVAKLWGVSRQSIDQRMNRIRKIADDVIKEVNDV